MNYLLVVQVFVRTARISTEKRPGLRHRRRVDTGFKCGVGGGADSAAAISTGASCGMDGPEIWQNSLRHRKSWFRWIPADRAISEILAPASNVAATSR